jgi:hypothetical protein
VDAPADTLPPVAGEEPPVPAETFDVPPVVAVPPDAPDPDDGLLGPLQAATPQLIAIDAR